MEKNGTIKGIIFDADGTLLDSMGAWDIAPKQYVENQGKVPVDNLTEILFPLTPYDTAKAVRDLHHIDKEVEEVYAGITEIMKNFYETEVEAKPGVIELLRRSKDAGIKMVIATNTDRECIEAALKRLGITEYFTGILTCAEVGHSKAEPDIFFKAMELIGTKPEESLLVEDGLFALETGEKIGMVLAGVYDEVSKANREKMKEITHCYIEKEESLTKLIEVFKLCSGD